MPPVKSNEKAGEDWRLKRYGKILGKDVESQLRAFREFAADGEELRSVISGEKAGIFWKKVAASPMWAHYYLEPFEVLLARFAVLASAGEVVKSIASKEFPADHVDAELGAHLEAVDSPDDPKLIALLFALMANLDAIALFSCTMSDLVLQATKNGLLQPLARAASVDVGVLSLPGAQLAMKAMQLGGDSTMLLDFLSHVGQGPHRARSPYQEVRWVGYLLREQGAFECCSHDEIHELIVNGLGIYGGDMEHKDSKKALFALFRKWRRGLAN